MKKKLAFFGILFSLLLAGISANAQVSVLYQNEQTQTISGGLTLKSYRFLTSNGWVSANAIIADMNNKNLALAPLDKSVSSLATVKSTVTSNNALAGVNGDFFAWATDVGSGLGSSINTVIENGKLTSSSANSSSLATFFQSKNGSLGATLLTTRIELYANDKCHLIGDKNKYSDLKSPVIYTSEWGDEFKSVYEGMFKIIVDKNGNVLGKIGDRGTVPIPIGGFVLVYGWNDSDTFSHINIGNNIRFEEVVTPDLSTIQSAIGGGTYLLSNGAETPITHGPTGRHPRTGIGTDASGKILYLVTVDGRSSTSIGATLPEFAGIMQRIGVWTGINFDGGGSTQMAVKNAEGKVEVVNEPTENRAVANVAGVVSNGLKGSLTEVKLELHQTTVEQGGGFDYKLIALDNYGNILNIENAWYGNADKLGVLKIEREYEGLVARAEILVVESSTAVDSKNKQVNNAEETYNIFGSLPKYDTVADNLLRNKIIEKRASYDNVISQDFSGNKTEVKGESTFIYLDNSSGILGTSGWQFLNGAVNNVATKNVFIIAKTPLGGGGFENAEELDAFYDTLQQGFLKKGKNVYIFSNYRDSVAKRRDGIRYITASNSPIGSTKTDALSYYENYKYIELSVKGNEVTWFQRTID